MLSVCCVLFVVVRSVLFVFCCMFVVLARCDVCRLWLLVVCRCSPLVGVYGLLIVACCLVCRSLFVVRCLLVVVFFGCCGCLCFVRVLLLVAGCSLFVGMMFVVL